MPKLETSKVQSSHRSRAQAFACCGRLSCLLQGRGKKPIFVPVSPEWISGACSRASGLDRFRSVWPPAHPGDLRASVLPALRSHDRPSEEERSATKGSADELVSLFFHPPLDSRFSLTSETSIAGNPVAREHHVTSAEPERMPAPLLTLEPRCPMVFRTESGSRHLPPVLEDFRFGGIPCH
jgi:hypothetical protein